MRTDSDKSFALAIQDVIHDLQTPLSSVKMSIDFILSLGNLSEKQNELGERALIYIQYMEDMVSNLLQVAWIDADQPLNIRHADLREMIQRSLSLVDQKASAHGIRVDFELPDTAMPLDCDEQRITQVFVNLLSNAIKFNRAQGQVFMRAWVDGDTYLVSVHDQGHGIEPADQEKIFTRFYRAESVRRGNILGNGLGLSNARDIMIKHGGRLWFETEPGTGTTFFASLPAHSERLSAEGTLRQQELPDTRAQDGVNHFAPPAGGEQPDGYDDALQESADLAASARDDDQP
jgi:signal transduction histidine kinase